MKFENNYSLIYVQYLDIYIVEIYFPSIANLKCTRRQVYPWFYIYTGWELLI